MKNYFVLVFFLLSLSVCFSQEIQKVKITDLEKIIAGSKKPLIVNFWATFCKPCVEEIPYFQEEVKNYNNSTALPHDTLQLLLVSLDLTEYFPQKIKAFASGHKFTAPIVWLDEYDADYFCPKIDPGWSGAIPATLFINNNTRYRKFFEEQLSQEKLKKEINKLINFN